MQKHPYFSTDKVIVLAHRGGTEPTENTIQAITQALRAGADVIETDIQATSDGVAVLFHDDSIERLTEKKLRVADLEWAELSKIDLAGGTRVASLEDALRTFPQTRFNIDVKAEGAIDNLVHVVESIKAHDRVLVSSFSNNRRLKALKRFSRPVATSASASGVLKTWFYCFIGVSTKRLSKSLEGIGALQIPRHFKFLRLDTPRFIRQVKATGTLIHYWTINEPEEIIELARLGASGIVTDVPELAVQTLRKA